LRAVAKGNPTEAHPRGRLGFFDGIRAFFGGFGFVVGQPSIWGWALVPAVIATLLFLALAGVAIRLGSGLADAALAGVNSGAWTTVGTWLLSVVFWAIGLIVSFLLAMSLAQPLSGFALDAIARRQEVALGGRSWPEQPWLSGMFRSLRVALSALVVSLPLLALLALVTFAFPPASVVTIPLKFLVTGLAVAYDLLDYPFSIRGLGVRARLRFVRAHWAAVVGFGASAALVLLVPGVPLLLLPIGVAGAARLVTVADQK
jgi:CysZ protein